MDTHFVCHSITLTLSSPLLSTAIAGQKGEMGVMGAPGPAGNSGNPGAPGFPGPKGMPYFINITEKSYTCCGFTFYLSAL